MKTGGLDAARIAVSAVLTAGLAVGGAAALLYHSSRTSHIGPTSAALSDAFSEAGGASIGLAVGAMAAAALVRHGGRIASGALAGVLAFLIGVVPYSWLTSPSDVSTGDNLVWLFVILIFAAVPIFLGAVLGALVRGPTKPDQASGNEPG